MFLNIIIFLIFLLLFTIVPALFIFKILKISLTNDSLVNLGVTLMVGVVILCGLTLIIRLTGFDFWLVWILPLISIVYLVRKKNILRWKDCFSFFSKKYSYAIILIVIGVMAQNILLFRGGINTATGVIFPALQDNMWNIAIVNELLHNFPPQNPAISGELLKNHHYFYLFFLAIIHSFTKIPLFDLYYRLGPFLVSLLYGLSLYTFSSLYTKNKIVKCLSLVLGYFSGNFAYLIPLFLGRQFDWKGNTFFSDQPFDQIFNPYSVLGFALFLFTFYALYQALEKKDRIGFGWSLITGLFLGIIYGFKSFAGVILILAFGSMSAFYYLVKHRWHLFKIMLFSLMLFVPVYFLITESKSVKLSLFPGWILTEMMVGKDKLDLPYYADVENYYRSINNLLGFGKIKFIEFLTYTIGNLGMSLLGLYYLLKVNFIKPNKNWKLQIIHLFAFFSFLYAFFIPVFFNLGSSPYNIIQFTPYALVLLSLYTAFFLGEIFNYFQKKKLIIVGFALVIVTVALSIPVNIKNLFTKIPLSGQIVSYNEMLALKYLKNNSKRQEVILLYPKQFGSRDSIYIPALTGRQVYLASIGFARQTGKNPDAKMKEIEIFFTRRFDKEFISKNAISYIYLFKESLYREKYQHIIKDLSIFYENDDILILKI